MKNLSFTEAKTLFENFFLGNFSEIEMEKILRDFAKKGETVEEIAAAAEVMQSFSSSFVRPKNTEIFDVCGTGGSGEAKTFNLSTTVAFVLSGEGICVAKHGNRAASSKSGSADMLLALGVNIEKTPEQMSEILQKTNIAFLFAQKLHPKMAQIMPIRKKIGTKTIFNLLGPLTSPANPERQLMGVFAGNMVEKCASVLQKMKKKSAMVVFGKEGLDEISLTQETVFSFFSDAHSSPFLHNNAEKKSENGLYTGILKPEDFGFSSVSHAELLGGNAEQNAEIFVELLHQKKHNPKRDLLLFNAGVAFFVAGKSKTIEEGIGYAEHSIDRGNAWEKFEAFQNASQKKEERI